MIVFSTPFLDDMPLLMRETAQCVCLVGAGGIEFIDVGGTTNNGDENAIIGILPCSFVFFWSRMNNSTQIGLPHYPGGRSLRDARRWLTMDRTES